jgi:hypothetical protein
MVVAIITGMIKREDNKMGPFFDVLSKLNFSCIDSLPVKVN